MFRVCTRRAAHAVAKTDATLPIAGKANTSAIRHQGITAVAEDQHGHAGRIAIYVKAGPANETKWNAGVSQYLRLFGRKDGMVYSQFGYETALEEACVRLNNVEVANREYLVYSVEGNRDTLVQPELFDILWANILFPKFHPYHLGQLRKQVQQDTADIQQKYPRRVLLDNVFQTAYKGSALGNSEFCPSYNIKGIKDDTLWDFWEKQYLFDNITVVGVNVDPHHAIESAFGAHWFQRAHVRRGTPQAQTNTYVGGENHVIHHRASDYDEQFNDVNNTYTALAFPAPTSGKLSTATKVVAQALRNLNSRTVNGHAAFQSEVFASNGLVGVIVANATPEKLQKIVAAVQAAPANVDAAVAALKVREAYSGDVRTRTAQLFSLVHNSEAGDLNSADLAANVRTVVQGILASKPTLVHYGGAKAPPTLASLKF